MEYTPEQLNYFRLCYIAFNLIPEGLRKVFKQEWDFLYKPCSLGEWKDTPKNGVDFYNKESKKSHTKNTRCLATIQKGNTADWDCTCLIFAILFSDSIGTSLSPSIRNDVDDLRQVRNGVAHISEGKLTDFDFQNCVGKVIAAFNSLRLPISLVEEVKNQTSFPTAEVNNLMTQVANLQVDLQEAQNTTKIKEEEVKALTQEINSRIDSFCSLAFKPSHQIIRRSKDVTRIMKKMEELEEGIIGAISTIYMSGNPGCGKSQIARQIGQEYFDKRSREGLTFVATLNAETLQTLADSYLSLARQLGVTEYTLTNLATSKVHSFKKTIQHLKRLILPKMKQFPNWLIIADNVVDLRLVRDDLPPTGSKDWGQGQVLITTQDNSTIPPNGLHTFHEPLSRGMQADDAVELLKEVSQITKHEEVEKVAEVLEYQPLALAAAAVYVQTVVRNGSPNYCWTSYLKTFARGEREATEEPLAKQNSAYSTTMTNAIKMAIARASESDEVLCQAFCFLSLSASDSLPIEALVNFAKIRTTGQTEELIRAKILTSSLITCLRSEDGKPCYVRVHNIVHEVLKAISMSGLELKDRVQCISAVVKTFHSLIEAEQKLFHGSGNSCKKLRKITAHCKALYEIIASDVAVKAVLVKELTNSVTIGNVVSWLCSAARVSCELCYVTDAILFSKSARDFVQYTAGIQGELLKADVFFTSGKISYLRCEYKEAISRYENARTIYVQVFGEKHANVAECNNYLGNVFHYLGQYIQAKGYHEKALSIRKKIYGEEHPDVAASYINLGIDYSDLGQHNREKECYERALIIGSKIYGEEHVNAAASYHNLAVIYSDLGQHNQAKECDKKALSISKKIYGEQHPDVAASYHNLGVDHRDLGQLNQAKECDEKALSISKKVYGEEHPDVAASYHNLGVDYIGLGQHYQARECHDKALSIRKKIYCEKHPDVAASYHSLGIDYIGLGHHNQAKECHEKALSIRKTIYGEEHPDVAASYHSLGFDCWKLGEHNQAKECDEKAVNIRKKIYGEEHPEVADCFNNLAVYYRKLKQYKEAEECLEKALMIRQKIYGEQHAQIKQARKT